MYKPNRSRWVFFHPAYIVNINQTLPTYYTYIHTYIHTRNILYANSDSESIPKTPTTSSQQRRHSAHEHAAPHPLHGAETPDGVRHSQEGGGGGGAWSM
jgi:hypothetical protein